VAASIISLLGSGGGGSLLFCSDGASGLLLLDVGGDQLLVLGGGLFAGLEAGKLLSLGELLATETLLGDEALDLGGLVVGLVSALDFTASDVAAHVVLLLVEAEDGGNLVLSLLEEARGNFFVGAASDGLVTVLLDLEGDHDKVGAGDAAADGPSSAVASSLGVEGRASYRWEGQLRLIIIK